MYQISTTWTVSAADYDRITTCGTSVLDDDAPYTYVRIEQVGCMRGSTMFVSSYTKFDSIKEYFEDIGWRNIIPYAKSEGDAMNIIANRLREYNRTVGQPIYHLHLVHIEDV